VLDYPLAAQSVKVAGLTTEEVASQLQSRVKVLDNPRIVVKVRDYASHNVIVTGLVADPGAKFLRRETIPLYVLLVEAQTRPEALSAIITRKGQPVINVNLSDQKAMSLLVSPGDVIKVVGSSTAPTGFSTPAGHSAHRSETVSRRPNTHAGDSRQWRCYS